MTVPEMVTSVFVMYIPAPDMALFPGPMIQFSTSTVPALSILIAPPYPSFDMALIIVIPFIFKVEYVNEEMLNP